MVEGQRVFTPVKLDKGRNVGVYAKEDRLVAEGLVWERPAISSPGRRTRRAIARPRPRRRVRRDPNYRAFAEATELLFINAVLLSRHTWYVRPN
jgi:hypothetical protein